jgi:hypothetical protein
MGGNPQKVVGAKVLRLRGKGNKEAERRQEGMWACRKIVRGKRGKSMVFAWC